MEKGLRDLLQQNNDVAGHRAAFPDSVDLLVSPGFHVDATGGRLQEAHDVGPHERLDVHYLVGDNGNGRGGEGRRRGVGEERGGGAYTRG